jgi:post-segregation antitoxin (ccd killing protein)
MLSGQIQFLLLLKQLHQVLLLLKRSRCLNISAFCREAIAEKLERLEAVK